jgi:citrate synthase
VRRCLVLVADHELNPSTYVARCVASTRATPYAVVLAALCALSGPIHGGESLRVEAMLTDFMASKDLKGRIADRMRLGERPPGFGHPMYPQGDPRALAILEALKRTFPKRQTETIFRIASEVQDLSGRAPHLDFALSAMSLLLGLPRGSAQGLFLVGRTVGWIGHAMEQYAAGALIRPRARYVGILPGEVQALPGGS